MASPQSHMGAGRANADIVVVTLTAPRPDSPTTRRVLDGVSQRLDCPSPLALDPNGRVNFKFNVEARRARAWVLGVLEAAAASQGVNASRWFSITTR